MKYLNLTEVFNSVKNKLINKNLTIEEVAENTGVKQEVVEFLLDPNNNIIDDLSRIILFTKTGLEQRDYIFKTYTITEEDTQLKITRVIKPKCSIYFDKPTQEFYHFTAKYKKHNKLSNTRKMLIMSEMKDFLQDYLK